MKRSDPLAVTPAQLSRAQRWPIGQPVTVTKDNGSTVETTIRSAPWKLGGTWVVMVDGISGGYALARVAERTESPIAGERSLRDREVKRRQLRRRSA